MDTLNTNFFGPKRVTESFIALLQLQGKIINIASASGPMFLEKQPKEQQFFMNPSLTIDELLSYVDSKIRNNDLSPNDYYGFSKACVNCYTFLSSKFYNSNSNSGGSSLKYYINSCTPGFINTDMTNGMGASLPPSAGTKSIMKLLFDNNSDTGMYFGSDGIRSPLNKYRGPGEPPYVPTGGLVL